MRTGAWTHKYARGVAAPSPRRFGRDTRVSASAGREVGLGEPFILPSSPKLTTNDGKAYLTLVICRGSRVGCNTDEFAGDTPAVQLSLNSQATGLRQLRRGKHIWRCRS